VRRPSNYDKHPVTAVGQTEQCRVGWKAIGSQLLASLPRGGILCVECYPGSFVPAIQSNIACVLQPIRIIRSEELLKTPDQIEALLAQPLGRDPVFGRMNGLAVLDYFDPAKLAEAREILAQTTPGTVLVVGVGASLIAPEHSLLVYADMARWEIQRRWRENQIGNFGRDNKNASPAEKYKCGYFVEWRAADRLKKHLFLRIEFLLDTNAGQLPKMISGTDFRSALSTVAERPFRVVPYFDPGPWGGHWMEEVFDLPRNSPNYAWCFDCVPEENSLLLGFGDARVEVPAIDLVFHQPLELLGEAVHARFGAEFPIRFDFLDTMDGGNLSLQVHPLTGYIREQFGMHYTQDESYYLLDAAEDASVFLGLEEAVDPLQMTKDLILAQEGAFDFPVEKYVHRWPARKHDHFLVPAGTVHCSGRNSMVLEISATPYIFTFKLWDWGRLGLDGNPRPIHLDRGIASIQWDRTTNWVRKNLINRVCEVHTEENWREEITGLHEREFIETRRHWFRGTVPHHTNGGVNVLNLVEGEGAIVESPSGSFPPLEIHYAETFIVPAAVGPYTIRPIATPEGKECATIKAFVRRSV
jgi:mannose-6-phosphate isomerase class I